MPWPTPSLKSIGFTAALLCLAGCQNSADRLDAQTRALIQREQELLVGVGNERDPRVAPETTATVDAGPAAYHRRPSTVDPGPGELPVRTAARRPAALMMPESPEPKAAPASPKAEPQPDPSATPKGEPAPKAAAPQKAIAPDAADTPVPDEPPNLDAPAQVAKPRAATILSEDGQAAPNPLDLEQILSYAIVHSRSYQSRKEDLFLSALDLLAEKHLWGPRFFDTVSARLAGAPEGGDTDHALTVINEFKVTQRLPYGGQVSAAALASYVAAMRIDAADPGDHQTAAVVLSLTQPLLRGAGTVAQEGLIQSHRDLIYQVRGFEQFRREFLVDIATDYYGLLQQQTTIANIERQVANFDWLHKRIEALAKAGREPYFEVQRAQQQVLFARNNLIEARDLYHTRLDAFKINLGMPLDDPRAKGLLIVATEVVIPVPALDRPESVATALRFRLDLQTAADQADDARRRLANARNGLLPDLDLTASLDLRTDPAVSHPGLRLNAASSAYSVGLEFGVPLDRRREQIAVRQSVIGLERAERSHTLQREQAAQQVRRSIRQIELAQQTFELQERNIEIARKRLRGVVLRLRQLGPRDFIEAQQDLLEAENRRDAALREVRVNVLRYLLDTGQMRVDATGKWQPPARLMPVKPPARRGGVQASGGCQPAGFASDADGLL